MVVAIVFCDDKFIVPKRLKKQLKDYRPEELLSVSPSPSHGDIVRKNNFLYVVVGKEFTDRKMTYEKIHEMMEMVKVMLQKHKIKKVVMPMDIFLGKGHTLDELVASLNIVFDEKSGVEVSI